MPLRGVFQLLELQESAGLLFGRFGQPRLAKDLPSLPSLLLTCLFLPLPRLHC